MSRTATACAARPDDAIALIERLQDKQGEFGVFLQQAHNWADWEETKRSYELYARYVMPHFSRANRPRAASYHWCGDNRDEFSEKRQAAAKAMFDKHEAEQRALRDGGGRRARRRAARRGEGGAGREIPWLQGIFPSRRRTLTGFIVIFQ